jgi:hypothetical protein
MGGIVVSTSEGEVLDVGLVDIELSAEAVGSIALLTSLSRLEDLDGNTKVDLIEAIIRAKFPLVDLPVNHYFGDGVYVRELPIPAGTLLTGKLHKTKHVVTVSSGTLLVWSEELGTQLFDAPAMFVSHPGTRRVIFAFEDSVITTAHLNPDNCEDIDTIESKIIEKRENPELPPELNALVQRYVNQNYEQGLLGGAL